MFWRLSSDNDITPIAEFPHFLPHYTRSPRAGDKTFYNLVLLSFPKIPFCQFNFFKDHCFTLVFNDSYFSYNVAAKCKAPYFIWCSTGPQTVPTQQETPAVLELWRKGTEAPAERGLDTLSAFCVIYSSSLDSTTHLGLHEICYSSFPNQTSCYVTSDDTLAILQHLAQQVLTNTGLMLELFFC